MKHHEKAPALSGPFVVVARTVCSGPVCVCHAVGVGRHGAVVPAGEPQSRSVSSMYSPVPYRQVAAFVGARPRRWGRYTASAGSERDGPISTRRTMEGGNRLKFRHRAAANFQVIRVFLSSALRTMRVCRHAFHARVPILPSSSLPAAPPAASRLAQKSTPPEHVAPASFFCRQTVTAR